MSATIKKLPVSLNIIIKKINEHKDGKQGFEKSGNLKLPAS